MSYQRGEEVSDPSSESKVATILRNIAIESVTRWGDDLVSVVLFGSHARGDAHPHSDIDLLVVVEGLPQGWRERGGLELSLEQMGLQWGKAIQATLVEPDDVRFAVDSVTPFLLEIRDNYHCLIDWVLFFQNEMERLEGMIDSYGIRKLAEHKWEVPELVSE